MALPNLTAPVYTVIWFFAYDVSFHRMDSHSDLGEASLDAAVTSRYNSFHVVDEEAVTVFEVGPRGDPWFHEIEERNRAQWRAADAQFAREHPRRHRRRLRRRERGEAKAAGRNRIIYRYRLADLPPPESLGQPAPEPPIAGRPLLPRRVLTVRLVVPESGEVVC